MNGRVAVLLASLVCMLATVVAAWGLTRLTFDDGFSTAFRSSYPEYRAYKVFSERFSTSGSSLAIHLSSDDFAEPAKLQAVSDFVLELGLFDHIVSRTSALDLRTRPGPNDLGTPVFPVDFGSYEENANALAVAESHPLNRSRLITADLKNLLVGIRLDTEDQTTVAAILQELDAFAQDVLAPAGIRYANAGVPVLRVRVIEDIVKDQEVINVAGAGIGLLLCLVMFRSFLPAMNAGLPAIAALVWVLGFLGHSGIGINTLTNTLPALILVLAFADSMHMTYELERGKIAGKDIRTAVMDALKVAGPPCFLTSLTTAVAFASLLISQSELVRAFAIAGITAVFITFFAVVLLNPLMALVFARLQRRPSAGRRTQPLLFPARLWQKVLAVLVNRPVPVASIGLLLLVGAVWLHSLLEPRFTILENVNRSAQEILDHNAVETMFAPLSTVDVTVTDDRDHAGSAFSVVALEKLRVIHEALAGQFGAQGVVSLWTAANWIDADKPETAGPVLERFFNEADPMAYAGYVAEDGQTFRVSVLTPDLDAPDANLLVDTVRGALETVQVAQDPPADIGGLLPMTSAVAPRMIMELNYSFLTAAVVSGLLIGAWCRRVWVGFVAFLVNVLPITLAGAWLSATGTGLQFASGLALTIAFGIAVDDTIHVFGRLRPKLVAGLALTQDDLRAAFMTITPVLAGTTAILIGGLASALLSAIPTIVLFAQLSMAVLLFALLVDILILPALLSLVVKWQMERASR